MSHKTSPARVAAFLAAVRATGNQSLAAERAKVSRSWVQLHRSTDPAFDAAVREAVAEGRASLANAPGQARSTQPARGWASLDGEELVVRGTNGVRVQIARARLRQWTPRVETRFLAALAGSCNVKHACAEAGLSVPSAYKHRARRPAFAARWDAAVAAGYEALDLALVESAIAGLDPEIRSGERARWAEAPLPPMDVYQAILLMGLHQRRARGLGKWPGVRR